MTLPITLKCRLDRSRKFHAASRHWTAAPEILRKKLDDSDSCATQIERYPHRNDTEDDAAQLLLSMSSIVSNEIKNDASIFDDDGDACSMGDASGYSTASIQGNLLLTPRDERGTPAQSEDDRFTWNRARTVSIDSPLHTILLTPRVSSETGLQSSMFTLGRPALISPNSTPMGRSRPIRRASLKLAQKAKQEQLKLPKMPQLPPVSIDVREYRKKALDVSLARGCKIKTIGRKKFSWKNYPELEAFLIANRDEYLRHSALNYTVQQKQYNNRLTEQLLEVAADHGYVFDEVEFSFVTVRDRIRCYFKSYVQSAKKRGVTVGYAARKAGLLSEKDLRVEQEGEIVVPDNF